MHRNCERDRAAFVPPALLSWAGPLVQEPGVFAVQLVAGVAEEGSDQPRIQVPNPDPRHDEEGAGARAGGVFSLVVFLCCDVVAELRFDRYCYVRFRGVIARADCISEHFSSSFVGA